MNFNEEKEQQNVELKYLDTELGIEIDLKKDKLYKLRKTTKIVKPTHICKEIVSPFDQLDHLDQHRDSFLDTDIIDDFEENIFMTDELIDEIVLETWEEG